MNKTLLALAAAAAAISAAPALADPHHSHDRGRHHEERYRGDRYDGNRYDDRIYDSRGRYVQPRRMTRNSHIWRGRDGRYYCRRDNGTTGLLVGAGLGALAGHQIAGSGDRTIGALLGGVLGGVLGREIDRGSLQCR